jgi:hypothetical protein
VSTATTVESIVVDVASVEDLLVQDAKAKTLKAAKVKINFFIVVLFYFSNIYLH